MAVEYKAPGNGAVVDIGGSILQDDVGKRLIWALNTEHHPSAKPTLPDELLYDDIGLFIWNDIIFTPEFYQTHDEIALFQEHGAEIAKYAQPGVTMIDLGAGDTRKVEHLLAAFEGAEIPATYLALDISMVSLAENIKYLFDKHSSPEAKVTCAGLWGTFRDGRTFVHNIQTPRLFLSLGSVLCNDPWIEALSHLRYWGDELRPTDLLLIGMDGHMPSMYRQKLWDAYHGPGELYRKFFLNGFNHANRLLGERVFCEEDWDFEAEFESQPTVRHRFFFRARRDIRVQSLGRIIPQGQEFDWFDAHKYGEDDVCMMAYKAGLKVVDVWQAPNSEFRQYLMKTRCIEDQREDADSAVSGLS